MGEETKENKSKNNIVDIENLDVDHRKFRITHYQMEKNGNFSHDLKSDWGGRDPVVDQSLEIVKERINIARQKVINGEVSPIAYYMEKCISDLKTLAQYTGMAKWKVKRHLKVRIFKKLNDDILKRYADFFGISLEELKDIDHLKH